MLLKGTKICPVKMRNELMRTKRGQFQKARQQKLLEILETMIAVARQRKLKTRSEVFL